MTPSILHLIPVTACAGNATPSLVQPPKTVLMAAKPGIYQDRLCAVRFVRNAIPAHLKRQQQAVAMGRKVVQTVAAEQQRVVRLVQQVAHLLVQGRQRPVAVPKCRHHLAKIARVQRVILAKIKLVPSRD